MMRNQLVSLLQSSCRAAFVKQGMRHYCGICTNDLRATQILNQRVYYSISNRLSEGDKPQAVTVTKVSKSKDVSKPPPPTSMCGDDDSDEDDEDSMEQMFIMGPSVGKIEWGGPTRGGARPEPTRYGDWERKGRASDF